MEKTKGRSIVSILTALVMLVAMLVPGVGLAEEEPTESTYSFTVDTKGITFVAGIPSEEISVQFVAKKAADNVLFKVKVEKPAGSTLKLLATDSENQEYDIVKDGWGPPTGFSVTDTYNETTLVKVVADKAGSYTVTLEFVQIGEDTTTVLAERTIDFIVSPNSAELLDTIYVDGTEGSDENNGALAKPVKTIATAVAKAMEDDSITAIEIAAGDYKIEAPITINKPLTIKGAGKGPGIEATKISVSDVGFYVSDTGKGSLDISNLMFTDGEIAIHVGSPAKDAPTPSIKVCKVAFEGQSRKGIYAASLKSATILDSTFNGIQGYTKLGEDAGIDFDLKYGECDSIIVEGNTFSDIGNKTGDADAGDTALKIRAGVIGETDATIEEVIVRANDFSNNSNDVYFGNWPWDKDNPEERDKASHAIVSITFKQNRLLSKAVKANVSNYNYFKDDEVLDASENYWGDDPDFTKTENPLINIEKTGDDLTPGVYPITVEPYYIDAEMTKLSTYPITITQAAGGTITASIEKAREGDTITLTITPAPGKRLKAGSLKVNGTAISGTTFTMPAANVTITAEFESIPSSGGGSTPPSGGGGGVIIPTTPTPTPAPKPSPAPAPSTAPAGSGASVALTPVGSTAAVTSSKLTVRGSAGGAAIGTLNQGDRLVKLGQEGAWTKVQLPDGSIGYVATSYLGDAGTSVGAITSNSLTIRATAVNGKALGTLTKDDQFEVLGIENGWAKIQLKDGTIGYVAEKYISVNAAAAPAATITSKSLTLRSSAGGSAAGTLKAGDSFKVLYTKGAWAAIELNGKTYFVAKSFVVTK